MTLRSAWKLTLAASILCSLLLGLLGLPHAWSSSAGQLSLALDPAQPRSRAQFNLGYRLVPGPEGAPFLIVLHGGPGGTHDSYARSEALLALRKQFTLVFYDQRGSGLSSLPRQALAQCGMLSTEAHVEDLERLRQHLRESLGMDRPIALYGHSYGGYVALAYAQKYPQHVGRLILHSSGVDFGIFERRLSAQFDFTQFAAWKRYLAQVTDRAVKRELEKLGSDLELKAEQGSLVGSRAVSRAEFRLGLEVLVGQPELSEPELVKDLLAEMSRGDVNAVEMLLRLTADQAASSSVNWDVNRTQLCTEMVSPVVLSQKIGQSARTVRDEVCGPVGLAQSSCRVTAPEFRASAARVTMPVLILGGRKDRMIPVAEQKKLHQKLPHSELVILEEAGHNSFVDQPDAFLRAVREFLRPSA